MYTVVPEGGEFDSLYALLSSASEASEVARRLAIENQRPYVVMKLAAVSYHPPRPRRE